MNFKEKIIEASYELFASKGYEKTTISDIIKAVGSSRGGFYHHFNSKEEILEAITEGYIDNIKMRYYNVMENHKGSSVELFNKIFKVFHHYKEGQLKEWTKLQNLFSFEGNHAIILKIAKDFNALTTGVYTEIITEGSKRGEFTTKYPQPLAELWSQQMLQISRLVRKELYKNEKIISNTFTSRLDFTEELINRELGLNESAIEVKSIILDYMQDIKEKITLK